MKLSQVYLDAAKYVDGSAAKNRWFDGKWSHRPCCPSINEKLPRNGVFYNHLAHVGFREAFRPGNHPNYWFGKCWGLNEKQNNKRKDHRVFALLFMRELAKDAKL